MKSKITYIALSITVLIVALFGFYAILDATTDVITDPTTQAFAGTVVAGGEADVVLTEDLYLADTDFVTAITATGAGAVPVADSYVAATNTLTITGLGVDTPQDITVTHGYEVNDDLNGVNDLVSVIPVLMLVGIMASSMMLLFYAFKKKKV